MVKVDPTTAPGMVKDIAAALAPNFSDSDPDAMTQVGEDLGPLIDQYRQHQQELLSAISDFKQNVEGSTLQGGADAFTAQLTHATSAHLAYARALQKFATKTGANVTKTQQDQLNKGTELSGAYNQISALPDKAKPKMPDGSTATSKEDALAQLKQQMTSYGGQAKDQLVQQNTGVYQLPPDGSYDDQGNPIQAGGGGGGMQSGLSNVHAQQTAGNQPGGGVQGQFQNTPTQQSAGNQPNPGTQNQLDQQPAAQSTGQGGTPSGSPQGGGSQQGGGPKGGPGGVPGGGPGGPQIGGTSSMHGAAIDHAPPPAISGGSASGAVGGAGPAPSFGGIGGVGGAPRSGPAPSISGGGGSSDGQGTRASGGQAVEKPAAQQPSQSSGSQGSGMRSSGGGASASAGSTSAQGGAAAGYREAMRGDTAGGATGTGRHLDRQQEALGLGGGSLTGLSPLALSTLTGSTSAMGASAAALPGEIQARNPLLSEEQAELRGHGGVTVIGGTIKGFLADGFTWGDNPVGDFQQSFLDFFVLTSEDSTIASNKEEKSWSPVLVEATSNEDFGVIRPEFDLPPGVRVMARSSASGAPAQTWLITDIGSLAVELVRWRIAQHQAGSKWKPVAVGFLHEVDAQTVHALSQLGVETYWDGRPGFELASEESEDKTKEATAKLAAAAGGQMSEAELAAKRENPLAHARAAKERDPSGLYDPNGLPGKEAGWYQDACEVAQKDNLTNTRWLLELEQRYKDERTGGPSINL